MAGLFLAGPGLRLFISWLCPELTWQNTFSDFLLMSLNMGWKNLSDRHPSARKQEHHSPSCMNGLERKTAWRQGLDMNLSRRQATEQTGGTTDRTCGNGQTYTWQPPQAFAGRKATRQAFMHVHETDKGQEGWQQQQTGTWPEKKGTCLLRQGLPLAILSWPRHWLWAGQDLGSGAAFMPFMLWAGRLEKT